MKEKANASAPPSIVWFRLDLRLSDNLALASAVSRGRGVIPLFIWAPEEEGGWSSGGASKWWLHQSLRALESELQALGSRMILRIGPSLPTLRQVLAETGADAVYWNRRYEPAIRERDTRIKDDLKAGGFDVQSFNAALLHEPWTIQNRSGKPFQVFSPFWRYCLQQPEPPDPLPAPARLPAPAQWPTSIELDQLQLHPKPDWAASFWSRWRPGTAGAGEQLKRFLRDSLGDYADQRNRPDRFGTSRLSPHLHFGEISPRQVWAELRRSAAAAPATGTTPRPAQGSAAAAGEGFAWRQSQFVAELGWREFSHHLLYHFPHTVDQPLRPEFRSFRWRQQPDWLAAWRQGRTGYPLVDAGMRELWSTGWMHNRVRMVVASFLVKDLLLDWREGTRWFWDTLVDADLAQNTLGWQWTAGCGADAAPFFRVFNPNTQGEKFDPEGTYVRQWVPELAALPARWIHRPHEAPTAVLASADVRLGDNYPQPIISHAIAREVALEAYATLKTAKG